MVRKHPTQQFSRPGGGPSWICGRHPVEAALANPRRRILRLVATGEMSARLGPALARRGDLPACEVVEPREIARLLGDGARHQGAAVLAEPLAGPAIANLAAAADLVLVLDRISDPHNAGAIIRSAAAFGAAAVVMQERHAPPASAALASAASGALEWVPLVRVANIARALADLKRRGFWITGLDTGARAILGTTPVPMPAVLVLGAEGGGLRRLTREACDLTLKIASARPGLSLNVSNAAAIALHAIRAQEPVCGTRVSC